MALLPPVSRDEIESQKGEEREGLRSRTKGGFLLLYTRAIGNPGHVKHRGKGDHKSRKGDG